jgi:quinol monooxygenase YgiN
MRVVLFALASAPALAWVSPPKAEAARRVRGQPLASHTNIYPMFTINDMEKAKPHLDGMVEATKAEAGCLYYGWTICGDKLHCRETYVDGAAASVHLGAAGPLVGAMLESGAASLDEIGIMGTAADLAAAKEAGDGLGCAYWEVWDSFSNFKKEASEVAATANFCTIQPTFTLADRAKAEPFMKQCVEATKSEKGCVYYGWTISGDKLYCREAYVDGAAVDAHLKNAVPIVGAMLDSGAASLDKIEVHGPKAELEKCKAEGDALGAKYFETYATWSKFSV